jgi:nucleotide-binding universal stress UspA family protein/quercetin dioxygenase-like cupin family protein
MPGIQTILHPTDFSDNSRPAFQTACALARDYRARLLVLHVMIPSASPLMAAPPPDPHRPAEAQESLPPLPWPQAADAGIRLEHRLAEGDPADEVLRLIQAERCDLVVMGTHGKSGLGRLLTGSVAEEVLRKAVCPVMVVKSPLPSLPGAEPETTAGPGDLVDVRPLAGGLGSAHSRILVRTEAVEVFRLIVHAGQTVDRHASHGDLIVQCLEGRVGLTALGQTRTLHSGMLVHLPAGERPVFQGIENASLLLITLLTTR